MSSYRLTDRAASDLLDLYLYGIEQFGFRQAERYKLGLDECFSMLADHPRMGRASPTIRPDLRRHEHGSHVILYREEIDHVRSLPCSTAATSAASSFEANLASLTNRTSHALFRPIFRAPRALLR